MNDLPCPCGKNLYAHCCEPFHLGEKFAEHAEQLMRSRYSAFALTKTDYLIATTALGQQPALNKTELHAWSIRNQWQGLEVTSYKPKLGKQHAEVEFKAYYHDGENEQIHHEISYFVHHDQRWYFLDPSCQQTITMKQPCICGSGKKFKGCCAGYL